jgi:muconolactone delta-isomerase
MRCMVTFRFAHGQQEAIAARVPAEQAHVKALIEQGLMETGYLAADRSVGWMVLKGESQDHVLRTLTGLPLYPYMALELAPLLEIVPGRGVATGAST